MQRGGRSPAERAARAAIGEHGLVDVAGARFKVMRFDCLVGNIAENGDELLEARLRLRREVVGMIDMLGAERSVDARGDVAGVDEVARLLAVALDRELLALGEALRENADDAALAAIALALAVDIGEAQDDEVEAKRLLVEAQVMLDRDL